MDKSSKVLFFVIFLAILTAVGLSFYKYMVKMDYYLQIQTECNPAKERCFITECNPEEDSECPENEAERRSYYKIIMKKAYLAPDCDPKDEQCPEVTCDSDSACQEIFCDETTVSDGETCHDPETYLPNSL